MSDTPIKDAKQMWELINNFRAIAKETSSSPPYHAMVNIVTDEAFRALSLEREIAELRGQCSRAAILLQICREEKEIAESALAAARRDERERVIKIFRDVGDLRDDDLVVRRIRSLTDKEGK